MKTIQDVAHLIAIRNFLSGSIENLNVKLTREDVKNIQTRVAYLDKVIVEQALKMDLSKVGQDTMVKEVREFTVESTDDPEVVIKKFSTQKKESK